MTPLMKTDRMLVAALAALLAGSGVAAAQTPGNKNLLQAETLLNEYRFEEASALISKEIKAAQRKKQSTAVMEAALERARKGDEMLHGTEKTVFVDSIVVDRSRFLAAFRLSRETGRIGSVSALFPRNAWGEGHPDATGYVNELGDKGYIAAPDSAGQMKLFTVDRLGNAWTAPEPLAGIGENDTAEGYPFVMADGVTLYYAAQGSESLGGYDIFVTRYNPDLHAYVRPENIGMPFNSPANDYLYVVDETANIGWFVSDRNQPADKVCIYIFIPNESREVYDIDAEGDEAVRRAARIAAIAETQRDKAAVAAARGRLAQIEKTDDGATGFPVRFVINDRTVYDKLSQFRKPAARRLAAQWLKADQQLRLMKEQLSQAREAYGRKRNENLKNSILQLEKDVETLEKSVNDMAKNMRKAELQ